MRIFSSLADDSLFYFINRVPCALRLSYFHRAGFPALSAGDRQVRQAKEIYGLVVIDSRGYENVPRD